MQTTQELTLHMPLWAWGAVAALALVWIYVMLPERFKLGGGKPKEPNYFQLERASADLGPAPAAKAPAPPATPKWTAELLAALDIGHLNALVSGFWQARVCNVEAAGNDLLIFRPSTGRLFAVAHCVAGKAGLDHAQSLWELVRQRAAPLGLLYGVGGFTEEAIAFAKDKHLKLLAGSDLLDELGHLKPEQQRALLERAAARPMAAAA